MSMAHTSVEHARVAGVVLAAGASTRMGCAKQLLLDHRGVPLVVGAAQRLLAAGCLPVLVLTGAHHAVVEAAIRRAITSGLDDGSVVIVHNIDWAQGLSSSIRSAVVWLENVIGGADAVLLSASDMPGVSREHLEALVLLWRETGARVASDYSASADVRTLGIPAVLPRSDWVVLLALHGDRGARDILNTESTLSVSIRNDSFDLDTPADVDRWRDSRPSSPPSRSS